MKTNLKLMIQCVVLLVLLAGCAIFRDRAYSDYSAKSLTIDEEQETRVIIKKIQDAKNTLKLDFDACHESSSASSNHTNCKVNRNRVLAMLTSASDEACNAHLKTIYGNEATSNITLGTLATVFTAASAGVSATAIAAKTNYAVAGTIASAERSLVNDVVYKSILVPTIHQKILTKRATGRQQLNDIFLTDYSTYPIERAVSAVVEYHYFCSFMTGLQLALQEGSSDTQALRLRKLWEDAKNQLEVERQRAKSENDNKFPDLSTDENVKKYSSYALATKRFEEYDKALKNTELASVNAAPSPAKDASAPVAPVPTKDASSQASTPAAPASATN